MAGFWISFRREAGMAKHDDILKEWIEARKRHRLSHAQVKMARELGMNPKMLGKITNHQQEPWKVPLPRFIEDLYFERFGKRTPDDVRPIEAAFKETREKERKEKEEKKKRNTSDPSAPRPMTAIPADRAKADAARDDPRDPDDPDGGWALFDAEASYADSIMKAALGDIDGSIAMLEEALASVPGYAPALYSMGTARYFQGLKDECRRLFQAILDSPDDSPDLLKFIDHAGDFYIERKAYEDGYDFYRKAAARFPDHAVFHQGISCCAGHLGLHEEELAASRRALELEPENQKFVNDLGWSLYQGGDLTAARETLERAVAMDPADDLARENLRIVREALETKTEEPGSDRTDPPAPSLRCESPAPPKTRRKKIRGSAASPDQTTLFDD